MANFYNKSMYDPESSLEASLETPIVAESERKKMAGVSAGLARVKTKVNDGESFFKRKYSKFIKLIHARDFLAECLGTFILVVSVNTALT